MWRVVCGAGLMETETPVDCLAVLHFRFSCCLPFDCEYIACGFCGKHKRVREAFERAALGSLLQMVSSFLWPTVVTSQY